MCSPNRRTHIGDTRSKNQRPGPRFRIAHLRITLDTGPPAEEQPVPLFYEGHGPPLRRWKLEANAQPFRVMLALSVPSFPKQYGGTTTPHARVLETKHASKRIDELSNNAAALPTFNDHVHTAEVQRMVYLLARRAASLFYLRHKSVTASRPTRVANGTGSAGNYMLGGR